MNLAKAYLFQPIYSVHFSAEKQRLDCQDHTRTEQRQGEPCTSQVGTTQFGRPDLDTQHSQITNHAKKKTGVRLCDL